MPANPILRTACAALLALSAAVLALSAAHAREPGVPLAQLQPARFAGVIALPGGQGAAVALRVADGGAERVVPIFIGPVEAAAIARAERGVQPPRPLTHELLTQVLAATGASLRRIVIDDLRDGVYYATLELRLAGAPASIWVDARPSDALALAVGREVPILLGPRVVDAAVDPNAPAPPPGARPGARPGHTV
jgi:bifunctional DNase/RNase